jgi:hypothetical protein
MSEISQPNMLTKEEYEGNEGTGIEVEDQGEEALLANPWDANKIRVDAKNFSLRNILDLIKEGDLDLAPDFQRHNVWKIQQKCRLIESILLRIPLPAFYFSSSEDGSMQVVDGVQRLSAIRDFANNQFPLAELEYLSPELEGKRFNDITGTLWTRRFNSTQISANVIDPQTPYQVKFNIFKRINTGGSPLNAQEIRHCMSDSASRDFLKKCTEQESFTKATTGTLGKNVRMVDREVVLRFCAFRCLGPDRYDSKETMDAFLTRATEYLDKHLSPNSTLEKKLREEFDRAMNNAYLLFGDHAFRKWPLSSENKGLFNRALFEVWSVILADYDESKVVSQKERIIHDARKMMTEDLIFLRSISASTGDSKQVMTRFDKIRELMENIYR